MHNKIFFCLFSQCFSYIIKHISLTKYPTLAVSVLIFNYIMNHIENFQNSEKYHPDVKNAAELVIEKIKEYYWRTKEFVYTIATDI
jgi:hypothetical protein